MSKSAMCQKVSIALETRSVLYLFTLSWMSEGVKVSYVSKVPIALETMSVPYSYTLSYLSEGVKVSYGSE